MPLAKTQVRVRRLMIALYKNTRRYDGPPYCKIHGINASDSFADVMDNSHPQETHVMAKSVHKRLRMASAIYLSEKARSSAFALFALPLKTERDECARFINIPRVTEDY